MCMSLSITKIAFVYKKLFEVMKLTLYLSWLVLASAKLPYSAAHIQKAIAAFFLRPFLHEHLLTTTSKTLQHPSMASILAEAKPMNILGVQRALTPDARAFEHWRRRNFVRANSAATSPVEHAVSTAMLGPHRPSTNDKRFAEMDAAMPVPSNGEASKVLASSEGPPHPTKTPVAVASRAFLFKAAAIND
eukprot:gnl/MRDRNA2_/MRDRNA2_86781_c0_seq4.p1 gnl/MRDRNA2_/MRDRNA2_86781_c0~~gnl/MRDRNA2_/MRDRNA2_86781_c0_seq4.p1  ORF type:complete len:190 (-),score=23.89 gnl/MRDRNA2_/MRDRNA2_86781_c0_seq4:161-730(-)